MTHLGKMVECKMLFDSYQHLTRYVCNKRASRSPLRVVVGENGSAVGRWDLISKRNACWSGGDSGPGFTPQGTPGSSSAGHPPEHGSELALPLTARGLQDGFSPTGYHQQR